MQATNGWYAIVAGPERISNPRAYKEALVRVGEIPGDTVITRGQGYVAEVWRPSTFKPLTQAKYDGTKQLNLRSGELVLNVSSLTSDKESGRFPVLSGYANGRLAFTARLEESSNEEPNAEVSVVRLDPTSPEPQVIFSSFWGGAHCCTVTKIATKVGTEWRVVQGKTIDGDGGYTFDDIDGDGAAELLSVDQSFLYTFAPYAGSWAPESISNLSGDRLIDVTAHPTFRTYMRQELYRIEYLASREPNLWRWYCQLGTEEAKLPRAQPSRQYTLAHEGNTSRIAPDAEGVITSSAVLTGRETMTAELEVVVDRSVNGEELLCVPD
jgi:hypothetical protein